MLDTVTAWAHGLADRFGSADPADCFDTCKLTSARVVRAALDAGFEEVAWIQLAGSPEFPDALPRWSEVAAGSRLHYVARVGGLYVDVTARQFDPAAEYPEVAVAHLWDREYDITDALEGFLRAAEA